MKDNTNIFEAILNSRFGPTRALIEYAGLVDINEPILTI
jgi:hypothetical protein